MKKYHFDAALLGCPIGDGWGKILFIIHRVAFVEKVTEICPLLSSTFILYKGELDVCQTLWWTELVA